MKENQKRRSKLRSKLERLKIRDNIAIFLRKMPLKDFEENQVGNHIYSGKGKLRVGSRYTPVVIRIRMIEEEIRVIVLSLTAGIRISCPFEPIRAAEFIRQEIKKGFN